MRTRGAIGDYDGVITFAQCELALSTAGFAPATATRALLDQLRRYTPISANSRGGGAGMVHVSVN
jgi:hypothetical protein